MVQLNLCGLVLFMQVYQCDFICFVIECGVLCFGEFIFKFGCISFYFFNVGLFDSGLVLVCLGCFYVEVVIDSGIDFDVLFGLVYKGIFLVVIIVVVFVEQYQCDLFWCFNCKEVKDYGEGGMLVGVLLSGWVLIIDDVIIVGIVICEVMQIIDVQGVRVVGVLIVLNCQECGKGELLVIQEVECDFGMLVVSIVFLEQVLEYFVEDVELKKYLLVVEVYCV